MSSLVEGEYTSIVKESWCALRTVWHHQLVFLKIALIPLIVLAMTNISDFIPESQFRYVVKSEYLYLTIQETIRYTCLTVFGGLLVPSYLAFILTGQAPKNPYFPAKEQWKMCFKMISWLVPLVTLGVCIFFIFYFSILFLLPLFTYDKSFFSGGFVFLSALWVAIASSVLLVGVFALICPAIANGESAGPMLLFRSFRRLWGYFFRSLLTLILVFLVIVLVVAASDALWAWVFSFMPQEMFDSFSAIAGVPIWGYFIAYFLACMAWIQARYYTLIVKKEVAAP